LKEVGEGKTGDARYLFRARSSVFREGFALKQVGRVYRHIDEKSMTSVLFNFAADSSAL
jgi:hypothetical protein